MIGIGVDEAPHPSGQDECPYAPGPSAGPSSWSQDDQPTGKMLKDKSSQENTRDTLTRLSASLCIFHSLIPIAEECLMSQTHLLISKISNVCQEMCDIKDARKLKSNSFIQNYINTSLDKGKKDLNYTQEPDSNNSAKEGSDEGDWDGTYSSHSKLCHREPSNPNNPSVELEADYWFYRSPAIAHKQAEHSAHKLID